MGVAVAAGGTAVAWIGVAVAAGGTAVTWLGVAVTEGALSESPEQATSRAERSTTPPTSKHFHARLPSMVPIADGEFMVFPRAHAQGTCNDDYSLDARA